MEILHGHYDGEKDALWFIAVSAEYIHRQYLVNFPAMGWDTSITRYTLLSAMGRTCNLCSTLLGPLSQQLVLSSACRWQTVCHDARFS